MNLLRRCAEVTESLFYRSVFDEMCRGSVEGGLIPVEENDVLFFTTHPIDEPFPLPADLQAQMTVFVQSHPKFGIHILPRNKKNGKRAKRVLAADCVKIHWPFTSIDDILIVVPIFLQWISATHDRNSALQTFLNEGAIFSTKQRNTKIACLLEALYEKESQSTTRQKALLQCKSVYSSIVSGHGQVECDDNENVIGYSIKGIQFIFTVSHTDGNSN
jgi:hypothetical protein